MTPLTNILRFRAPTPLAQATAELEQAQRDLLTASAHAEYYVGLRATLETRVARLRKAVAMLAAEAGDPPSTN